VPGFQPAPGHDLAYRQLLLSFHNQNVNENGNQKSWSSPYPPLVLGFQPAPGHDLAFESSCGPFTIKMSMKMKIKSRVHRRIRRWCSVFNWHLATTWPLTAPAVLSQSKCQ